MKVGAKIVFAVAAGLALGGQMGMTPAAAKKAKSKVYVVTSGTNSNTTAGTQEVVTQADTDATEYRYAQTKVTIPKNTALTVVKKTAANTLVLMPGNDQLLVVDNLQPYVYSNKVTHLTKAQYRKMVKQSKAWAGTLSKRQRKVIGIYTGDGSDKLNNALRYPKRKASKVTRQRVKDLTASLKTFKLQHGMTVYRGTSNQVAKLSLKGKKLAPGAVYSDPGFASTTTSRGVATGFTSQVMLRINFPAGYHGAYVDPISTYEGEDEYLLNPQTKLVVTKVQQVTVKAKVEVYKSINGKSKTKKVKENDSYKLVTLNLMK